MKKIGFVAGLIFLAVVSFSFSGCSVIRALLEDDEEASSKPEIEYVYAYVASDALNMREEPSASSKKVGLLYQNTKIIVNLTESTDDWALVVDDTGKKLGYVSMSYLSASTVDKKTVAAKSSASGSSKKSSSESKSSAGESSASPAAAAAAVASTSVSKVIKASDLSSPKPIFISTLSGVSKGNSILDDFDIGVAYLENEKYDKAIKKFKLVLETVPDSFEAYSNLAASYYLQGQYSDALTCAKKAAALRSSSYIVSYNKGLAEYSLGNYSDAIATLSDSIGMSSSAAAYTLRANAYAMQKRYDQAKGDYNSALKIDSSYEVAKSNLTLVEKY